jgi:TPR repeat protein
MALDLFRRCAARGSLYAKNLVADWVDIENSSPTDLECWDTARALFIVGKTGQALSLCENSSCEFSVVCQIFLGWTYYGMSHYESAMKWFDKAMIRGSVDAIFAKGCVHYAIGDFSAALAFFQQAANMGHARAAYWAGYTSQIMPGGRQDDDAAIKWYERSARQGNIMARLRLLVIAHKKGKAGKFKVFFERVYAISKIICIAVTTRNIHDERIVDIPKAAFAEGLDDLSFRELIKRLIVRKRE